LAFEIGVVTGKTSSLTEWLHGMVLYNYIFIGCLLLGAMGFALAPLLVVRIIAPRKRSLAKGDSYECGVRTYGETWVRFRIQYYIYALMFVVFDIETVFLFPWAVSYAGLGVFALVEMGIFLVILMVGLIYAWAKGVLRWV
jgi:NADH-quinone oxidoreductase subunit A